MVDTQQIRRDLDNGVRLGVIEYVVDRDGLLMFVTKNEKRCTTCMEPKSVWVHLEQGTVCRMCYEGKKS